MNNQNVKTAFFGSSEFSVIVLEELKSNGFLPDLIVTTPDKPKGRKMIISPNEVKVWGQANNVSIISPATILFDGLTIIPLTFTLPERIQS